VPLTRGNKSDRAEQYRRHGDDERSECRLHGKMENFKGPVEGLVECLINREKVSKESYTYDLTY